jgi:alpha-N-arabinofuranosidase
MMYRPFRDATDLASDLTTPDYVFGDARVPAVQSSVAREPNGHVVISLVNLDPHRAAQVAVAIPGMHAVSGTILTAAAMDAHNTFDHPDTVKPAAFHGAVLSGDGLDVALPAKAVVVLELN